MVDYRTTPGASVTLDEREYLKSTADGCNCIVNIGVGRGASVWCLRAGAPEAIIYGIDTNISHLVGEPGINLLEGRSEEMVEGFTKSTDLLFIDGSHSFRDVLYDLTFWSRNIPIGGLIVLHDYWHVGLPGIMEAVAFWFDHVTRRTWQALEAPDSLFTLRRIVGGRKSGG